MANSEILRLIQQSLEMDQERSEMSRALQHHHETFNDRHLNDDGFANLELNDHDEPESLNDHRHSSVHIEEKNYDVNSTKRTSIEEKSSSSSSFQQMWPTVSNASPDSQFEVLKQRYESLEKTLSNVEKEKQYFQVERFRSSPLLTNIST